jgi:hypothetical protein
MFKTNGGLIVTSIKRNETQFRKRSSLSQRFSSIIQINEINQ